MANQSRCDCHTFDIFLQILSIITHLGLCVASAWGYLQANQLFQLGKKILIYDVTGETLGVYTGLMATYYILFGILGILAELRNERIHKFILHYFNFLQSSIGRGILMFYLGSTFVLIPWDESKPYISKIPGSFQLACGISQILYGLCVINPNTSEYNQKNGNRKVNEASTIVWGSPENINLPIDSTNEDNMINNNHHQDNPVVANLFKGNTTPIENTSVSLVNHQRRETIAHLGKGSTITSSTTNKDFNNGTEIVKNPFKSALGE